jgi:hypothetical protein
MKETQGVLPIDSVPTDIRGAKISTVGYPTLSGNEGLGSLEGKSREIIGNLRMRRR